MGPFPHDAPRATISDRNPAGTDGFEFVEFAHPEPDELRPERWLDPESSANKNPKNYLVFGSGPHKCIGLEYALMNIAIVLADAISYMDWDHIRTEKSDEVE